MMPYFRRSDVISSDSLLLHRKQRNFLFTIEQYPSVHTVQRSFDCIPILQTAETARGRRTRAGALVEVFAKILAVC